MQRKIHTFDSFVAARNVLVTEDSAISIDPGLLRQYKDWNTELPEAIGVFVTKVLPESKSNVSEHVTKEVLNFDEVLKKNPELVTPETMAKDISQSRADELSKMRGRESDITYDSRHKIYEFDPQDNGMGNLLKYIRYDVCKHIHDDTDLYPVPYAELLEVKTYEGGRLYLIQSFGKKFVQSIRTKGSGFPLKAEGDRVTVDSDFINKKVSQFFDTRNDSGFLFISKKQFEELHRLYQEYAKAASQPKEKKKSVWDTAKSFFTKEEAEFVASDLYSVYYDL